MKGQPTFLRDDIPATRPELGEIEPGSPVVVVVPSYSRRDATRYYPAEVTSKARVWVTVTATGQQHPPSWRLRLDTQHDGSNHNYKVSFRTPEQALYEEAGAEAHRYLGEQGIRLDYDSPWHKTRDTIRLARIIWEASNVDG